MIELDTILKQIMQHMYKFDKTVVCIWAKKIVLFKQRTSSNQMTLHLS